VLRSLPHRLLRPWSPRPRPRGGAGGRSSGSALNLCNTHKWLGRDARINVRPQKVLLQVVRKLSMHCSIILARWYQYVPTSNKRFVGTIRQSHKWHLDQFIHFCTAGGLEKYIDIYSDSRHPALFTALASSANNSSRFYIYFIQLGFAYYRQSNSVMALNRKQLHMATTRAKCYWRYAWDEVVMMNKIFCLTGFIYQVKVYIPLDHFQRHRSWALYCIKNLTQQKETWSNIPENSITPRQLKSDLVHLYKAWPENGLDLFIQPGTHIVLVSSMVSGQGGRNNILVAGDNWPSVVAVWLWHVHSARHRRQRPQLSVNLHLLKPQSFHILSHHNQVSSRSTPRTTASNPQDSKTTTLITTQLYHVMHTHTQPFYSHFTG